MNDPHSPEISVVIVTPDHYNTIRKTIRHLRTQTVRDKLEVVIVAPSADRLGLDLSEMKDFLRFLVVEVGEIKLVAKAKAIAVRQAIAPIVAFAEDHCYPDPDWAEALIAAHQQGFAAVGPAMGNANPNTMVSWAGMFMGFGPYFEPARARETLGLPWHNISYKRQVLMDYGDKLDSMIVVEGMLLDELRVKGYGIYLEAAAKTYHVNISLLSSWVRQAFWGGWLFAAVRARQKRWPLWRRLLYIGGAPLIPLVRLRRTIREIKRSGREQKLIPKIFPALISGLVSHATGELAGYAFGLGKADEHYSYYEMARIRHVVPEDRDLLTL
ncbi:MAG TPA: glycosyltransferase [Thermodesulfobacteriota bacterium]|nr:glycosyltransferase [Thermodesulfobacteriota bacterium]